MLMHIANIYQKDDFVSSYLYNLIDYRQSSVLLSLNYLHVIKMHRDFYKQHKFIYKLYNLK